MSTPARNPREEEARTHEDVLPVRAADPVVLLDNEALVAPSAHAGFGVEEKNWEAGTCKELVPSNCKYSNGGSFFTEAAGHPLWGITKFDLNHSGSEVEGAPLKRLRVEIPKGLAANPEALATCSEAAFEAETCPAASKAGTTELKRGCRTTRPGESSARRPHG